jgi:hypothetical protein
MVNPPILQDDSKSGVGMQGAGRLPYHGQRQYAQISGFYWVGNKRITATVLRD